ncbi:MAG: hypothetical protein QOI50_1951 [Pseudonocardiales bacterium]|jgi:hypothetical protein|nr:hypothetical protein [Pseudonocardiales bacterium]MDT7583587.1 hypothetical protein [Pseudonocardiales bacterium]MDT7608818.1 hypothetical protein [Pseudonocardiales bacterium]MDT7630021.1 hypothetical protein [Pseudonocardiales bacterium]MDT7671657.1 hypothetical protein [Pseudonocardiales bacterium]
MNTRLQLFCVWSGPAFLVLYVVFFWGVAGWIPPSPPSWSVEQVGAFYAAHPDEIRVGQLGALIASTLLFPFWAVITGQIARIERGRPPVLALMQFGGAVLLQVFFVLCGMLWIVATFRPELDATTVRVLHDAGWLMFVMVFPAFVMQMFCIGIAALIDDSPDPIWPRWAGYLNMWVGFGGAGGGLAVFFKQGPFAWNGVVGFYIPVVVFTVWIITMTYLMHVGVRRQAAEVPAAGLAPAGPERSAPAGQLAGPL